MELIGQPKVRSLLVMHPEYIWFSHSKVLVLTYFGQIFPLLICTQSLCGKNWLKNYSTPLKNEEKSDGN